MKALDAFRDVLKELDKHESPTFEIKDFNYFFGSAIQDWISKNYSTFDIIQKEVDDLQSIIVRSHPLTINPSTKTIALPTDYRHILWIKSKVKFLVQYGKYAINAETFLFPERMPSAEKSYRMKNAYMRPSPKRPYFEIAGSMLSVDFGSQVELVATSNTLLDYIKESPVVFLNPNQASDYNQEVNNSTLFFNTQSTRNYVYYEVVRRCAAVFLENIESPRQATAANLEATRAT